MVKYLVGLAFKAALVFVTSAAHGTEDHRLLMLDGHLVKWGSLGMGTPATVTYAYVSERTRFPGARNCQEMVPLDNLLATSGIPLARFVHETEQAFRTWQTVAGITFLRSADSATADILIGAQATPRRVAFANVSYSDSGSSGARRIERALICLNPIQPWQIGFGGEDGTRDLRHALTHEAGHVIGLDHPHSDGQVMSFRFPVQFRRLQAGDIEGAVRLYGKPTPETPAPRSVKASAPEATIRNANRALRHPVLPSRPSVKSGR